MLRSFLTLVVFLTVFFLWPIQAFAEGEFTTSYDVVYDFAPDGTAQVTQKVVLKNLTNQYFASNFTLAIGSTAIDGISAADESGPMETSVDQKGGKTAINVKFNQQVTGEGKTQNFTLGFRSRDFTQIIGKTWEINLPKIPEGANIESYNLTLAAPLSIGDPTSLSPTPKSQSQSFDKLRFNFGLEQLRRSAVSVNFGNTQVFNFSLKYNLENSSLFPALTSVALPPATDYQDVSLSEITPRPLNVTIDEDGNYLAWYRISGRARQDITVKGLARLLIKSKNKNVTPLSPKQTEQWTKSDKYWEKENPSIKATLVEIFRENTPVTTREKAKRVYDYVVKTLKYDESRLNDESLERLGAVTALVNPDTAVCMEFTDLFITLARAAGIPAREVDGYAFSENRDLRPLSLGRDLLHAWPEYFDPDKGWVMVDPTWENTSGGADYFNKFDLSHIAFAKKGISSITPYSPGETTVKIEEGEFTSYPKKTVEMTVPPSIWSGFPAALSLKITNEGSGVLGATTLSLNSGRITVLEPVTGEFGPIPPYGWVGYKFNLRAPNLWDSFRNVFEIEIAGEKFAREVEVKPFFLFHSFPYLFASLAVLAAGVYLTVLIIHFRRHKAGSKAK